MSKQPCSGESGRTITMEEFRRLCAEEEGYTDLHINNVGEMYGKAAGQQDLCRGRVYDYNDDNSLDRLVRGLYDSHQEISDYHDKLVGLCDNDVLWIHSATVIQKQKAYCLAKGWGVLGEEI